MQLFAQILTYAGVLNFPPFAMLEPLNVTVDTSTNLATFDWVYDHNGAGVKCSPDHEKGLKYSVSGSSVSYKGTGADPSYYSFTGTLSGTSVTGNILDPSSGNVGTFTVTQNAPMVASSCGKLTSDAMLWPLPEKYTKGNTTLQVTTAGGGGANFFSLSSNVPFLQAAFGRYASLVFPHISKPAASYAPSAVTKLVVTVDSDDDSFPQLGIDESYTLEVSDGSATLHGTIRLLVLMLPLSFVADVADGLA